MNVLKDEAAAIFNATFGNIVGIFLTPALILLYIGNSGGVPVGKTISTLAIRVLVPLVVGQLIRKISTHFTAFVKKYKYYIDKAREYTLVFIIYTSFCTTFAKSKHKPNAGDLCFLILFQFILLCTTMVLAWFLLRALFRNEPKLRVMGLFGCTEKTLTVGLPLISAIYTGNKNLGPYTLPLLVWYAMQFILGTALTPRLKAFVETETKRLGTVNENPETVKPAGLEEEPADLESEAAEVQAIDHKALSHEA